MLHWRDDIGLWWPDYDHDPVKNLSFVQKAQKDSDLIYRYMKDHRIAIQAGAHVGVWPLRMAKVFQTVHAFECEPVLAECARRNCAKAPNVIVHPVALGATDAVVKMRSHVSAGGWNIHPDGQHEVRQVTIDGLNLKHVDAIVLDVEAYEVEVLKGAAETIKRNRPIIMVEMLPRSHDAILAHLTALKYRCRMKVHSDRIFTHA